MIKGKIIEVSNSNVLLLIAFEKEKIMHLNIKKDSYSSIESDKEIQNILLQYKKKKYKIAIFISGDEDPKVIVSKILEYELRKLMKKNE